MLRLSKIFPKFPKAFLLTGNKTLLKSVIYVTASGNASDPALQECNNDSTKSFIKNVYPGTDKRYLKIVWSDGSTSRFPHIFLRDSCKCAQCSAQQTIVNAIVEFGLDIEVKKSSISDDGKSLTCLWHDGHESEYSIDFLFKTRMPEERVERGQNLDDLVKDELVLWNREMMHDNIPTYDYNAVMNDDGCLFDSLYDLYQRGFVLLSNAPQRDGVVVDMVARIGWVRSTHFGHYWNAKIVDNPTNISYTNNALYFHTDTPYLRSPPSIAALHCIDQTIKGGKSLYVDSFSAVKQLKQLCPEAFDVLKNFEVKFSDEGVDVCGEYSISYSNPIIKLNKHGRITDFIVSNMHMVMSESSNNTSPDELLQFYEAYHQLMKILYAPENIVDFHMKPGQVAVLQNTRVLHGRTAIEATGEPLKRWIQVTYMDWDVIFSKLRVLQRKLGLKTPYLHEQSNDFF